MSFNWDLSDVSLMIRLGVMGVWVEDHGEKVPFSPRHIVVPAFNMTYPSWYWPWLRSWDFCVRFLSCTLTLFPSFLIVLFGRRYWGQLALKEQELGPAACRVEYLHQLFEVFSLWEICLFFIYLSNHLFISVWTRGCVFYNLGYNPMRLYLFSFSNCSIFSRWESFELAPASLWHTPFIVDFRLVWLLSTSLLPGLTRWSRLILDISCPSPNINRSPENLVPFCWRLILETKPEVLTMVSWLGCC